MEKSAKSGGRKHRFWVRDRTVRSAFWAIV